MRFFDNFCPIITHSSTRRTIPVAVLCVRLGDGGIVYELYDYITGNYNGYRAANIDISVKNHLIGFAAEKARTNHSVESVDAYMQGFGITNN